MTSKIPSGRSTAMHQLIVAKNKYVVVELVGHTLRRVPKTRGTATAGFLCLLLLAAFLSFTLNGAFLLRYPKVHRLT